MPSVYIVGGDYSVKHMFEQSGWGIVGQVDKASLLCFTGGNDVSPVLYGERRHPTTGCNWDRDVREMELFEQGLKHSIPMVGICRGGQFLNVMCGGQLYQDVDGHAICGAHIAFRTDSDTDRPYYVTSTHHQMMKPSNKGNVLVVAGSIREVRTFDTIAYIRGIECVLYTRQKCLCFQPHPEFNRAIDTRELFFDLIEKHLKLKVGE